jgi:mannosylglucosylglycerate synthase
MLIDARDADDQRFHPLPSSTHQVMKLALVHYASLPVIGGVEQIMAAHARLFAEHGHAVVVISQRGDADLRLPRNATADGYCEALRPALSDCDIVFVHNVMTMPFDLPLAEGLARLAVDLPKVRFMAWVHDLAACNPDLAPVAGTLRQAQPDFSYVAVSELRARQFRETTGVTCRVVPNGIDPAAILALPGSVAALARERGLLDGRTVLLHPTRLLRRKNVELGLAVIRAWKDSGHRGVLLVTGAEDPHNPVSREYAAWLREECERLDIIDEVIFVGAHFDVGDGELAALYRLADALFLPSRQEGFGLPILEAAMVRLPAFISDLEPMRSLAGSGAWRFSLETPVSELAAWMLIRLAGDLPGVERRRVLTGFTWDRVYSRYITPLLADERCRL